MAVYSITCILLNKIQAIKKQHVLKIRMEKQDTKIDWLMKESSCRQFHHILQRWTDDKVGGITQFMFYSALMWVDLIRKYMNTKDVTKDMALNRQAIYEPKVEQLGQQFTELMTLMVCVLA